MLYIMHQFITFLEAHGCQLKKCNNNIRLQKIEDFSLRQTKVSPRLVNDVESFPPLKCDITHQKCNSVALYQIYPCPIIKLTRPISMAVHQVAYCAHPTPYYQTLELSQNGSSQRMGKKTRSHMSTRKGSADSADLRVKFKTEMCKYYNLNAECPFSELCSFAHGEDELRNRDFLPNKYKTKMCSKFSEEGFCPYGQRCQFIHSQGNHIIHYQRLIETIRNDSEVFYEFFIQSEVKKPRRLSFFQKMEAVQESEEKAEEQCGMQEIADEMLVNRTRHNSL